MSEQSRTHLAHVFHSLQLNQLWTKLILALVPIDGLKKARQQVVEIFADTYLEIGEFQDAFDEDNPELREWAIEPYDHITEYDPHQVVTALLQLPEKILTIVYKILIVTVAAGSLFSIQGLWTLAFDGIQLIGMIRQSIPYTLVAVVILYLWLLHANKLTHRALSSKLRVGPARLQTRRRAEIVGYGIWNRSLIGQTGLFLVGLYYVLNTLPELPVIGRLFEDPAGYVTGIISGNLDVLHQSEGVIDATYRLIRRLR